MRQRNRGGLSAPVRWLPPSDLPASLVALIEMIFGETDWMVSHNRLARGLRKKPGTLKALGDHGALPYRLDGVRRVYAREDVAAFLGRRDASRAAGTMEVSSLTPTLSGGLANSSTNDFSAALAMATMKGRLRKSTRRSIGQIGHQRRGRAEAAR